DPIGGVWRTFAGLSTTYGTDRVRNTPISEQAIVGTAIGAALAGYRVVADIMFFDFIAVCLDQLANHAAKLRYMSGGVSGVPITVTTTVGSGRFGAQHTQSLEAWLMHTPGVKVVYPTTPEDAAGLMTTCIDDDDPCLFIQHSGTMFKKSPKAPSAAPPEGPAAVPLGVADVKRVGTDVSIIAYGVAVRDALRAADTLAGEGISAEVVDLRSLVPLDVDGILASVAKTRRAVVVHAATRFCGPGAEIAAVIGAEQLGPGAPAGGRLRPGALRRRARPVPQRRFRGRRGAGGAGRRLTRPGWAAVAGRRRSPSLSPPLASLQPCA